VSLIYLFALLDLCCSTWMSWWLLHIPNMKLRNFLKREMDLRGLPCSQPPHRPDRCSAPIRPVTAWGPVSCGSWVEPSSNISSSRPGACLALGDGILGFLLGLSFKGLCVTFFRKLRLCNLFNHIHDIGL
jgi:hypothetical protein